MTACAVLMMGQARGQSATIGSLIKDPDALFTIDNGTVGLTEAFKITGLPEAVDPDFEVLIINPETSYVRRSPLSAIQGQTPTAGQISVTPIPDVDGDTVQAALDDLADQIGNLTGSGFENLALADLVQLPEERQYDMNGFSLTWTNGTNYIIQGTELETRYNQEGTFALVDRSSQHTTLLSQGSVEIGRDGSSPLASQITLYSNGGQQSTAAIEREAGSDTGLEISNVGQGLLTLNVNSDDDEAELIVDGQSGNVTVTNNLIVLGDQFTPSDRNLKRNVRPYLQGLNVTTAIEPVRFEYNGLEGTTEGQKKIGLIAQEIEEIAPELVIVRDGVRAVNTDALIFSLINSVKELKAQNEEMRSEIDQLTNNQEALEQIVGSLVDLMKP